MRRYRVVRVEGGYDWTSVERRDERSERGAMSSGLSERSAESSSPLATFHRLRARERHQHDARQRDSEREATHLLK